MVDQIKYTDNQKWILVYFNINFLSIELLIKELKQVEDQVLCSYLHYNCKTINIWENFIKAKPKKIVIGIYFFPIFSKNLMEKTLVRNRKAKQSGIKKGNRNRGI